MKGEGTPFDPSAMLPSTALRTGRTSFAQGTHLALPGLLLPNASEICSLTSTLSCDILSKTGSRVYEEENMSWMDIFLLLIVMGGLALGYIQGLWRQAMSLGAILIGIILATYLQRYLTRWFGFIAPDTPLVIRQTVAFLFLAAVITIGLDVGFRKIFPETGLPFLGIFDRLGGIFIGFFTISVQVSAAVLVFRFFASPRVSWPIGESIRLVLAAGIDSSALVPVFHNLLVILVSIVTPLLPEGAPAFLTAL